MAKLSYATDSLILYYSEKGSDVSTDEFLYRKKKILFLTNHTHICNYHNISMSCFTLMCLIMSLMPCQPGKI